jgi:hypothetical protein
VEYLRFQVGVQGKTLNGNKKRLAPSYPTMLQFQQSRVFILVWHVPWWRQIQKPNGTRYDIPTHMRENEEVCVDMF